GRDRWFRCRARFRAFLSSPPFAEDTDDRLQAAQGQVATQPCEHDEICAPPLLMIRNLFLQNRVQANLGHARPPQYALPLYQGGSRNDEHIVASTLGAGLEQKRYVEHDERLAPGP